MIDIARVPAGVTTGGQFATTARSEAAGVTLAPPKLEGAHDPAVVDGTWISDGQVLISQVARVDGAIMVNSRGGHPQAIAANRAVASRLQRAGGTDLEDEVFELAASGAKVTMLLTNKAGVIRAHEGTMYRSPGGNLALINKGSRSGKGMLLYRADQHPDERWHARPLALKRGYGHLETMTDTWRETAATMPATEKPHYDDIPVWDGAGEPPNAISAVFTFTHPGFEGVEGPGSLFFATDVQTDNAGKASIVNGYGVYPSDAGLVSEHGSMYVSDLDAMSGRVSGFEPDKMTFSDAMALGNAANWENDIERAWDAVAAHSGRTA
ncbi:hypothetical protein [Cellulosimicrobium sp. Marseille-Q4280]|uniref:hypothetical protein n=1 Tax=Cellulosimicrobium sp. Marseille-Q4280 TaxID=2937992 RepID=UPI00203C3BA7|nr:hypothetical protein [Cellulosimicrobium sp. Marseille-Q4280]